MTNGTATMNLEISISDTDLCAELAQYPSGPERAEFAITAMKIGVMALRQAQGRIDAEQVRREGDRFIENLGQALTNHQKEVTEQVGSCLKSYFDPQDGRFNERVQRLVGKDGELESIIRGQIEGDDSQLVKTLTTHMGKDSPLMQTLNPEAANGVINALTTATEKALADQRERVLGEFSLDNEAGALSRLVTELKKNHGEIGEALQKRIGEVTDEFSLDKEDSALSRLVSRVERAQSQITAEFSLDEEGSALTRMRRDLLEVMETQRKTNERFQIEVMEKLAEMTARRKESERSTRHGEDFEVAVFDFVNGRAQKAGDIASRTGNTTGVIRNNKKGDIVVERGPEHAAAGARIVIEAKQNASYTVQSARSELEEARKNREAGVGIFVFSQRTAPEGAEPLVRYGDDILAIWDAENPNSDIIMESAFTVAKALSTRARLYSATQSADFEAIEGAVREIERQSNSLDEITTSAETIKKGSDRILDRARIVREGLTKQVILLDEKLADLRDLVGHDSSVAIAA